jgi:hypothetical protein
MILPLLSRRLFHHGYAVADVDGAVATLGEKFGITDWWIRRLPDEAPGRALAFAYVGDLMLELVDTKPGGYPIYDAWRPEDPGDLRLHHLGHYADSREEFDAIADQFQAAGVPMVMDEEMGDILYFRYFDTVPLLGHYSEFVLMKPGGEWFWEKVPRN